MQFLVTAYDFKEEGTVEKRYFVRDSHLKFLNGLIDQKKCLYAAKLEDDNKKPVGSVMIFEYPTKAELEAILAEEPYTLNKVWEKIEVVNC